MASLIRNTPFTGDTSDSEPEESVFEERTANNLPIKDAGQTVVKSSSESSSTIPSSPVLKTCAPYTAQNMKKVSVDKKFFLSFY